MGVLSWVMTPWTMNGKEGWKQQPVILVEGRKPFFADHPEEYIVRLLEMHDAPDLEWKPFHTFIGELKDGLETGWLTTEPSES
jgi:hypothetical protein